MLWTGKMVDSQFYAVADKLGNIVPDVVEADTDEGTLLRIVRDEDAKAAVRKAMGIHGLVFQKVFYTYFEIVDRRNGEVLDLYDPKSPKVSEPVTNPVPTIPTNVAQAKEEMNDLADEAAGWESGAVKLKKCTCRNGCKSAECDKL